MEFNVSTTAQVHPRTNRTFNILQHEFPAHVTQKLIHTVPDTTRSKSKTFNNLESGVSSVVRATDS